MFDRNEPPEHVSRLLVERRCEVYGHVAGLLMELHDALDDDDGVRARYLLADVRRRLRSALAFLTDEVYEELERVEALTDLLPTREGASIPGEAAAELSDRLQLLHVRLARSLSLGKLQDLATIVGLPPRLARKLEAEGREREARARRRELERECERHELEAREELGKKHYPRAIKALQRALKVDPDRPVLHNDLGVVLSLVGRHAEAVAEYRAAIELNERHPERRTEEWTTTWYNLGLALRRAAAAALEAGDEARGRQALLEARAALEEYTRRSASGPRVHEARGLVAQVTEQLAALVGGDPATG